MSRISQLYRKIKDTCLQGYRLLRITMNFACHWLRKEGRKWHLEGPWFGRAAVKPTSSFLLLAGFWPVVMSLIHQENLNFKTWFKRPCFAFFSNAVYKSLMSWLLRKIFFFNKKQKTRQAKKKGKRYCTERNRNIAKRRRETKAVRRPRCPLLCSGPAVPLTGEGVPSPRPSRESPAQGPGWTESLVTRAAQYHTHLFDLALLTDQLLAQSQKGQVGVLRKGQEGERGLCTVVPKRRKGEGGGEEWGWQGPGAGRGRKPTAVAVGTAANRALQQVNFLSQRPQAQGDVASAESRALGQVWAKCQECFIALPFDPSTISLMVSLPRLPN